MNPSIFLRSWISSSRSQCGSSSVVSLEYTPSLIMSKAKPLSLCTWAKMVILLFSADIIMSNYFSIWWCAKIVLSHSQNFLQLQKNFVSKKQHFFSLGVVCFSFFFPSRMFHVFRDWFKFFPVRHFIFRHTNRWCCSHFHSLTFPEQSCIRP